MREKLTEADREEQNARRRRAWDKQASKYDKQIGWFEGHVFATTGVGHAVARGVTSSKWLSERG